MKQKDEDSERDFDQAKAAIWKLVDRHGPLQIAEFLAYVIAHMLTEMRKDLTRRARKRR